MPYKYSFFNDYSEGAHPRVLEALSRANLQQEPGYGEDRFSLEAARVLREKTGRANADIHFVSGGTQANLIVLASALQPYESVIAAATAHINVHEAGAIEATGHKVNAVKVSDGKLTPEAIAAVLAEHTDEHMVKPKAVFISNATEMGTIYGRDELAAIAELCRGKGLYLYLDGARLGSALTSSSSDITLAELSSLVDVFYIGGTKNGALMGEAVIVNNPDLKKNFRWHLKQRGALLAKGRVLGVQFLELFKDDLFLELAKHANTMAAKLSEGIKALGYKFFVESLTNQIFPIFPNSLIKGLETEYGFYVWAKVDSENSAVRLVTSWATEENAVNQFLADLKNAL